MTGQWRRLDRQWTDLDGQWTNPKHSDLRQPEVIYTLIVTVRYPDQISGTAKSAR